MEFDDHDPVRRAAGGLQNLVAADLGDVAAAMPLYHRSHLDPVALELRNVGDRVCGNPIGCHLAPSGVAGSLQCYSPARTLTEAPYLWYLLHAVDLGRLSRARQRVRECCRDHPLILRAAKRRLEGWANALPFATLRDALLLRGALLRVRGSAARSSG